MLGVCGGDARSVFGYMIVVGDGDTENGDGYAAGFGIVLGGLEDADESLQGEVVGGEDGHGAPEGQETREQGEGGEDVGGTPMPRSRPRRAST
jgi:hypothetical protein